MRRSAGVVIALALGFVLGLTFVAGAQTGELCVDVPLFEVKVCGLSPTTTTTTTVPETTTTTESTTTTAPTTTTTTVPPGPVIPETLPYPQRGEGIGINADGGYIIMLSNIDNGVRWWNADYWGQQGLSVYPGMGSWVDGDRQGYECAYGHLLDVNGDVAGIFHAAQADREANSPSAGGAYAKVNDTYMAEAQRYLDGSLVGPENPGNELVGEDCFDGQTPIDAQGICDANPDLDERPRVAFFDSEDRVLDIRDYTNTDSAEVRFILALYVPGERAIVLSCDTLTGEAAITFEYSALGNGSVYADFNGKGPFG